MRGAQSALHAPAVQALAIQCASLLPTFMLVYGIRMLAGVQVTLALAALLQGAVAAVISRWWRLAPWWLPIQFLFPPALMAVHALQLPPTIFLIAFVLLLGLYWTTYQTQVPFYPSGPAAWEAVAGLLPQDRPVRFIDIGSGLGGLVLNLAARRPESDFVGIELAPLPWLASLLRKRLVRSQGRFVRGDYGRLDFAHYDVVFAYLSPAAMPGLWQKASAEMRPGTLLLSYEFPVPGVTPDITVTPEPSGTALYGWRIP